jgi:hypothetical protein
MKESNWKGLAIHSGPESWVFVGNDEGQALTGERAGRVFNREMYAPWLAARDFRGADALGSRGRQHFECRLRKALEDLARSKTPSTYGRTAHGNREILRPTTLRDAVRIGKSKDERR